MDPVNIQTWEDVTSSFTLAEVKQALIAKAQNVDYHKKAYAKKKAILKKAYALGLDKDVK
jgi:hypothetical protein